MILNLDTLLIDMDKVSAVITDVKKKNISVCIDGQWFGITNTEEAEVVKKAFKYIHKSYTYDKNLKRIK